VKEPINQLGSAGNNHNQKDGNSARKGQVVSGAVKVNEWEGAGGFLWGVGDRQDKGSLDSIYVTLGTMWLTMVSCKKRKKGRCCGGYWMWLLESHRLRQTILLL